jgi:hypothetical protein
MTGKQWGVPWAFPVNRNNNRTCYILSPKLPGSDRRPPIGNVARMVLAPHSACLESPWARLRLMRFPWLAHQWREQRRQAASSGTVWPWPGRLACSTGGRKTYGECAAELVCNIPRTVHKACTAHAGCCLAQHRCAVAVQSPNADAIIDITSILSDPGGLALRHCEQRQRRVHERAPYSNRSAWLPVRYSSTNSSCTR